MPYDAVLYSEAADPPATDQIIAYEKHLRRLDRSPDTIKTYIRTLLQADNELPNGLEVATTDELEEWLHTESPSRRGGGVRGKNTRAHYVRTLKGWGRWVTDPKTPAKYRLDYDATAALPTIAPARRKPKPTREHVVADLEAKLAGQHRLWVQLAAYAGLRCGEIARLNREDITSALIWVQGKGDKEREVPTHPHIWEAVKDLPPGPIAVDEHGDRLTPVQVGHRAAYAIRKAGYQTSLHPLRHRFGTQAYNQTGDLAAVQDLLGHSDPGTTRNYVEVLGGRMAAAVAAIPVAV